MTDGSRAAREEHSQTMNGRTGERGETEQYSLNELCRSVDDVFADYNRRDICQQKDASYSMREQQNAPRMLTDVAAKVTAEEAAADAAEDDDLDEEPLSFPVLSPVEMATFVATAAAEAVTVTVCVAA